MIGDTHSNERLEILRALGQPDSDNMSVRDVAIATGRTYDAAKQMLYRARDENLVRRQPVGNGRTIHWMITTEGVKVLKAHDRGLG